MKSTTGGQLLDILDKVDKTNSRVVKLETLNRYRGVQGLALMLQYAYNPYYRYHIRHIPKDVVGNGKNDLTMNSFNLLKKLVERKVTGITARRQLFHHIHSLTPEAGELVRRIVKKDMRCGIGVAIINAAFPNLVPNHKVMKGIKYDEHKLPMNMLISPKLDGIRAELREGQLYTTGGKVVVGVDHILRQLPAGVPLDGELTVPGKDFDTASGMIRSHDQEPAIVYNIFDVPVSNMVLTWRLAQLAGVKFSDTVVKVPHIIHGLQRDSPSRIQELYTNARLNGYEGLVIKDANSLYERKRSDAWMKLKPYEDAEFTVVGIEEGTGANEKSVGAIIINVAGVKARVGIGISDYLREVWWRTPSKIIGKRVTIKFMERTKKGRLRHPEFKAIRWDQ